ncbi:hypothetical protein [Rhodoligotrophos defluvii]|uniref:hypothetical protein n=1 Tax=Rhodoligotrophos defluvii TaxID=2561934 RepID=UPI0010CA0F6F|nr:hypothetical protein [Rhodoligotrophos defluvii]
MSLSFVRTLMLAAGMAFVAVPFGSPSPAAAQTIYDSNVAAKIDGLSSSQRAQVRQITRQSRKQMLAIFRQYGIDPNDKPNFDKLMQASGPLQAVARQERQAMAKVLDPDQLRQYDRIVAETRTRVRMQTQRQ